MIVSPMGPGEVLIEKPPIDGGSPIEVEVAALEGELASLEGVLAGPEPVSIPFDANLAEYLDDTTANRIVNDLSDALDSDEQSRADWIRVYKDGLDLLGVKIESRSEPWPGACGVSHPMILESAVRFQSKSSVRLFPAKGPAAVRVYGSQSDEVAEASRRVSADLNYYATEKMAEYFPDTETLLFNLPVAGSAFRKVYWDAALGRPCAHFIAASDFVMPAGFAHLETCPRYTELLHKSHSEVLRLAAQGYYLPLDTSLLNTPDLNEVDEKEAQITGIRPAATHSELVTLCEMHCDLELPEFDTDEFGDAIPLPYVVTWEKSTQKLLAIRRNWRESDVQLRRKIVHYVHYRYVPGLDNYGWGLIHLIGGIAKGSTSILRQLVDAGTLANLLGGFKSRTMRVKGEDKPIAPGEWRDVDVPAGKIADGLLPLPYKEPSSVLMQLYNQLVAEGKEFASIADLDISSASANAPVGTILALIERASEVITAVQARLHAAFKLELNLLAECIREYDSDAYDYDVENAPREIKRADYARRWQIRPVSDPSTATTAQRVMQYQAAMQFSQSAPQIYDIPRLHREMLANLGIDPPEDLVPDEQAVPLDPVSENMAILNSKPVKAFEYQDHKSHIAVHTAAMQDPELQQMLSQSPLASSIQAAANAHVAEHVAFEYRKQIEARLGVPLPPLGTPLPPEVEEQVAAIEAQAAAQLAQQRAAEAAQKQNEQVQQDPVFQLEQQKLQLEQAKLQQKSQNEQGELQLEAQRLQIDAQSSQAQQAVLGQRAQADQAAAMQRMQTEQMRSQLDAQKSMAETRAIETQSAVQQQTAQLKAQSEAQRVAGAQNVAEMKVASDRERALIDAQTRRDQIASQERIADEQLEIKRDGQEDDWRVEQEKIRVEVAALRQQLALALEKLDLERDKLALEERRQKADRRAQKQIAAQQPAGETSDADE